MKGLKKRLTAHSTVRMLGIDFTESFKIMSTVGEKGGAEILDDKRYNDYSSSLDEANVVVVFMVGFLVPKVITML